MFILLNRSAKKLDKDVLGWRSRIIAAGSSVSASTVAAHSNFVRSFKSAGLWTKCSEIGTLAGNDLTAALVKLKYPAGISGTLININYVSGNYTESTGLAGSGTQYLKTGWIPSVQIASSLDAHFSVYACNFPSNASSRAYIGARSNAGAARCYMRRNGGLDTASQFLGASDHGITAQGSAGLITCSNIAANNGTFYINSSVAATDPTGFTSNLLPTIEAYVNAYNLDSDVPANQGLFTIAGYSLGYGLSAADMSLYYPAWQSLQTALGRAV